MVCPHSVQLCKLKDCSRCEFSEDVSRCPKAHSIGGDDTCPTFEWVLKKFDGMTDNSRAYRRNVVNSVKTDIRLVGLDVDCKMNMMTRSKFKLLVQLLESRGLSSVSIRGRLQMFSALCAERLESVYESEGYELMAFNIPSLEVQASRPQDVPERAIAKFKKMMGKWASEGNTQLYVAAWFGLYAGMRWGDVCRIKWDVFVQTIDGVFICYTPHKTEKKSNKQVSFRVESSSFLDIEPYIGRPDSYVLIRHEGHCKSGQTVHGDYSNQHRSLHNRINAALKECGIGTEAKEKRFHALRKRFDTVNAQKFGEGEAARMAGHTVDVARKHYIGSANGRWS